jgi:hypothetical protein
MLLHARLFQQWHCAVSAPEVMGSAESFLQLADKFGVAYLLVVTIMLLRQL